MSALAHRGAHQDVDSVGHADGRIMSQASAGSLRTKVALLGFSRLSHGATPVIIIDDKFTLDYPAVMERIATFARALAWTSGSLFRCG